MVSVQVWWRLYNGNFLKSETVKDVKEKSVIPKLLTIAGSDPSGGAGIQADLKTFSALGCYGMSAITALTAQNTQGVSGVYEIPVDFVTAQMRAVFDDIKVDAVKIGMLGGPESIRAIADILREYRPGHIVLDPVMVAGSGDKLISDEAVAALKEHLIPLASVITPNLPEGAALLLPSPSPNLPPMGGGMRRVGEASAEPISELGGGDSSAALKSISNSLPSALKSTSNAPLSASETKTHPAPSGSIMENQMEGVVISPLEMEGVAVSLLALGARAVLLKGGHLGGDTSPDVLAFGDKTITLNIKRIVTKNTHGTGCTLSSALAAYLAKGLALPEAARSAKDYLTGALSHADEMGIGKGTGPVHHFWETANKRE